jgi:hypothetical protein
VSPEEAALRSETARQALEMRGIDERPGWMETYLKLREAGWPWRVAVFIAWAASPRNGRWPRNQEELATQVLGLTSDRQIGKWRARNPAINETITLLQAAPLFEHRADIYEALIKSASTPDYKNKPDRQLALEMLGDYVPRLRVDKRDLKDVEDLDELSDEELEKLARLTRKTHHRETEDTERDSLFEEESGDGSG